MEKSKKNIVVIGGGTGSYTLLRGLKKYATTIDITSIVTMADSGGSTGRLRDEFGQLPVGDVRMALVALADDTGVHAELLRTLFLYRFDKGVGLAGHNFGNLLLTALTDILGSEVAAIDTAATLLRVTGKVVPVTTDNVHLVAVYDDGVRVTGENQIDEPAADRFGHRITTLSLSPKATLYQAAREALLAADMIIFGPGDFYTSILANCVTDGFKEVLAQRHATLVYVANLMSRPGQTDGMMVSDYIHEITAYTNVTPDFTIVSDTAIPEELTQRYAQQRTYPVGWTAADVQPYNLVVADIVSQHEVASVLGDRIKRSFVRHDSAALATTIMKLLTPEGGD